MGLGGCVIAWIFAIMLLIVKKKVIKNNSDK